MGVSSELHRLMYRMAQAYYLDGQTQQEIAQRFGLSRPKVSRLLQRARDEQIVSITLVPPRGGAAELEAALEQRFGLQFRRGLQHPLGLGPYADQGVRPRAPPVNPVPCGAHYLRHICPHRIKSFSTEFTPVSCTGNWNFARFRLSPSGVNNIRLPVAIAQCFILRVNRQRQETFGT